MLAQEIVNTIVQFAVVILIAGAVYFIAGKNRGNFLHFTGLRLPTGRAMIWALAAALVFVPLTIALFYFSPLKDAAVADSTVAGNIRANGFSGETMAVVAVVALLKTSFTEELFFRGLIAKSFIRWFGFTVGAVLQAAVFGAVHLLIFVAPGGPDFSWPVALSFFGVPFLMGWVIVWLNERVGNGSIAPGWLVHGLGNLVAYPLLAFA